MGNQHNTAKLAQLKKHIKSWIPHLKRATGAYSVSVLGEGAAFTIVIRWRDKQGSHEHKRYFSESDVIKTKRVCDYVREITSAVFKLRGVK